MKLDCLQEQNFSTGKFCFSLTPMDSAVRRMLTSLQNIEWSLRTVENWIKELKALNLIKVELIRKQNKEVELRKIFALVKIDFSKMPGVKQISVKDETSRNGQKNDARMHRTLIVMNS